MRYIISSTLAIYCLMTVVWASPTIIEVPQAEPNYRLNDDVLPINYKIDLILEDDFGTNPIFQGNVEIEISTSKDNINEIMLHSKVNIKKVELKTSAGTIIEIVPSYDETTNIMTLALETPLEKLPATSVLIITYDGTLNDNMSGFYRSVYKNENNEDEWLATTQFQPVYTREAFPCFDEPSFKATFDVSITVPQGYKALSNTMEVSSKKLKAGTKVTFKTTPRMSSYLVAFIVSKFEKVPNAKQPVTIWTRNEALTTGEYANEIGKDILTAMEAFGGSTYADQNLGKLDMVAIPDFAAGAMENWGLITYREIALLWNKDHSTAKNKERVATIVAHEIAHNWFGNLLTNHWWSDTWLNEGFATYCQYFVTKEVMKDWDLENQFLIEKVHNALAEDALSSTKALFSEVNSPEEISAHSGILAYDKGGSVIRMMEHVLGTDNFKNGLKDYLNTNKADGIATREKLWNSLKKFNSDDRIDFAKVMDKWITQPGYPVLTLKMVDDNAVITQERFFITGRKEDDTTKWDIPIAYVTSHELNRFSNTTPAYWFGSDDNEVAIEFILHGGSGWIILNTQETGYYRVNYDDDQWQQLYKGLTATMSSIHILNRAQIVDDILNLARAGYTTYWNALHVTSYLQNEKEYLPWHSAFRAFEFLLLRLPIDTKVGETLYNHIKSLTTSLMSSVSFDITDSTPQIDIHKSVLAYNWACKLQDEDCITKSKDAFNQYMTANTPVTPDMRPIVYCTALREGGQEEWDFLWSEYEKTKVASEKVTILQALGCTKDKTILQSYLEISIAADSKIRKQDKFYVFSSVYSNSVAGIEVALDFLINNHLEIAANYEVNGLGRIISGLANYLTTTEQVDTLEEFVQNESASLGDVAVIGNAAIEKARNNVAWADKYSSEVQYYFDNPYTGSSSGVVISTILISVLSIIARLL